MSESLFSDSPYLLVLSVLALIVSFYYPVLLERKMTARRLPKPLRIMVLANIAWNACSILGQTTAFHRGSVVFPTYVGDKIIGHQDRGAPGSDSSVGHHYIEWLDYYPILLTFHTNSPVPSQQNVQAMEAMLTKKFVKKPGDIVPPEIKQATLDLITREKQKVFDQIIKRYMNRTKKYPNKTQFLREAGVYARERMDRDKTYVIDKFNQETIPTADAITIEWFKLLDNVAEKVQWPEQDELPFELRRTPQREKEIPLAAGSLQLIDLEQIFQMFKQP